jgi:hypothetical protein
MDQTGVSPQRANDVRQGRARDLRLSAQQHIIAGPSHTNVTVFEGSVQYAVFPPGEPLVCYGTSRIGLGSKCWGRKEDGMKTLRRRGFAILLVAGLISPGLAARARAQQKPEPLKLQVGEVAPDFKLQYFDGHDLKDVRLSDYRGKKNVVLAFYIFAFTGG